MAFEIVEIRRYAARDPKLASVSISPRNGLCIGFAREAAEQLGATDGTRWGLLIGSGDDAGKIRLVRNDKGAAARRIGTGGRVINFGRSASLGFTEADKEYMPFKAIDKDTIEVDLPQWELRVDARPAEDDDDEQPAPVTPKRKPSPGKRAEPLTLHDVTIDPTFDNETIEHDGETQEITTNQCAVLIALLRVFPGVVGDDHLCKRILSGVKHPEESLKTIISDLHTGLRTLGLDVQAVKGVGLKLAKL